MALSQYSSDELFHVFIEWINLFDFTSIPLKNVYELSDGVVIFKLLSRLSPTYFNINAMDRSPRSPYSKNKNIIEIKQCLEQFFNDVIDQDIAIDKMVDHNRITSNISYSNDELTRKTHFVRLLEMVLLCSIKCENKEETVHRMTSLMNEDQRTLMSILQHLMTNTGFEVKYESNKQNQESIENNTISEKEETDRDFRRLSMASYTSSIGHTSLLSPFGSKRKTKKTRTYHFDYGTKNDGDDTKQTLNFEHELNLKKDNIKLYEKNMNLVQEFDDLRIKHKDTEAKYMKLKEEMQSKQRVFEEDIKYQYTKKEKDLKLEIETNKAGIGKYKEEVRYKNDEINEYKKALLAVQHENDKYRQQLQDVKEVNQRQMTELHDELDIAQHQSGQAYTLEKQIKQYQIRLETFNDVQNELNEFKKVHQEKCDDVAELKQKLSAIPKLKQQIEKYKKEMIQYKVASIGAVSTMNDKKIANELTDLEDKVLKLRNENEELKLKLKTSRNEVRSLNTQIENSANEYLMGGGRNNNEFLSDITPDMQSDVARLQAENKQLRAAMGNKHTMGDLMDDLDTKSRLLQSTESQYEKTKKELNEVSEELENMKRTTAEWMRNSCSPQQYQNTLQQLKDLQLNVADKNKYIDGLKLEIDRLREDGLSSSSKIKDYENELNRTKQRYRDLFDYTEKQKERLQEYKKAIAEMHAYESNEKNKKFESQQYFDENQQLKEQIKIINQQMSCVQNACMNLLKRQVLLNNNLLSKPKQPNNTGFAFRQ
eukprot:62333_1